MSGDPLDDLDYYTLLGVPDDATTDAVKSAFRTFARRYHPDRFTDEDEEKRERSTRIFRRGSEAFQVLTDPIQRRAYDRVLQQGKLRLTEDARSIPERSSSPEPAATASPAPASAAPPSADHPIRSAEAQALFKRAVDAAKGQDWATAWKALRAANQAEPGNAFLQTRFQQVDAMLRKER